MPFRTNPRCSSPAARSAWNMWNRFLSRKSLTITANYSKSPAGTHNAITLTSPFADPIALPPFIPGGVDSVGLSNIVEGHVLQVEPAGALHDTALGRLRAAGTATHARRGDRVMAVIRPEAATHPRFHRSFRRVG